LTEKPSFEVSPQRVFPIVGLPIRPVTNQNTDFQSRFMLTTAIPYSPALSSASTKAVELWQLHERNPVILHFVTQLVCEAPGVENGG
jgi:hypothetical protein